MTCRIQFPGSNFADVQLPKHQPLAESLTVQNSPVLFGCRTGICGTCLVRVKGNVALPTLEEQEILAIYATDVAGVRLACQLDVTDDLSIERFEVAA